MKTQKQQKEVTILNIYRFKNVSRICFEVLSSNETDKYHTCFDGSAEKHSCTCPAGSNGRRCYHVSGLTLKAQEYFQSRQPVQPKESNTVAILVPEGVAIIDKSELKSTDILAEPVKKVDPMTEAQAFINRVKAEKMALHNATEGHFEERAGRLIPMR